MDVDSKDMAAKPSGQFQLDGRFGLNGQPLLAGIVGLTGAGGPDSAAEVNPDCAAAPNLELPNLELLSSAQIATLKLVDVLRLDLVGDEPQDFWEHQIAVARQLFPDQMLGIASADVSTVAYGLAVEAGVSVFWGSLEILRQFMSHVDKDQLCNVSWVLTASGQIASSQELADFGEELKWLYIELPVEKLTSRSSDLATAVDLRFSSSADNPAGKAASDSATQAALAVWAMFHRASLLVTDDIQAAYQARQVCFRKLAA